MKRISAGLALLLLVGSAAAEDPPPAPVVLAPVVQEEVTAGRVFDGTVTPSRQSVVGSEFAGLVVDYLVDEGDRVEAHKPLATLRTTILESYLAAARAERTLRAEELAELVNGSRPEEVREAQARVDQDDAELELRHWKLDAARRLFETRTISRDELREAELALRDAEEQRKGSVAALDLIKAGPRTERIAQAKARLEMQEAEVSRLEDEKERYVLRAPFDGYVVAERTEVGQWLAQGAPVAEIAALDEVDVVLPVLEDLVGGLVEGTKVVVSIGALPRRLFDGVIHRIVPLGNVRARTFPVRVRVTNERIGRNVLIKAGMSAHVQLAVGEKVQALLVPKDALVLGGPRPMVYVVDPKTSRVAPVPVDLGIAKDDRIQVIGPLEAGQQVVVRGNERLLPGRQVVNVGAGK